MAIKKTGKNPFTGIEKRLNYEVTAALEKAGVQLEKQGKYLVPVQTGRLQRSISYVQSKFAAGFRLIFGTGVRGPDVDYGKYIEYGTPKMQGTPFLRSAMNIKKQKIERLIASAIRRAFK